MFSEIGKRRRISYESTQHASGVLHRLRVVPTRKSCEDGLPIFVRGVGASFLTPPACANNWSMLSCEWPVRKKPRVTQRNTPSKMSIIANRIMYWFLPSLEVLSCCKWSPNGNPEHLCITTSSVLAYVAGFACKATPTSSSLDPTF
jgi:hypothetical protein